MYETPGGDAFAHRELAGEHHQTVGDDGDEDQADLVLPVHVAHAERQQTAQHQATRPAGVQDVQPLRLLTGEHRGDHGIDHRFDRPVAQGNDEVAGVQHPVGGVGIPRSDRRGQDRHDRRDDVGNESEDHRPAVADLVDDQAEQHDTDGKRPEPDAKDLTFLGFGQTEFLSPVIHDEGADDKPEGCGDQGNKAGPEQHVVFAARTGFRRSVRARFAHGDRLPNRECEWRE